jgi:hypothetical protein
MDGLLSMWSKNEQLTFKHMLSFIFFIIKSFLFCTFICDILTMYYSKVSNRLAYKLNLTLFALQSQCHLTHLLFATDIDRLLNSISLRIILFSMWYLCRVNAYFCARDSEDFCKCYSTKQTSLSLINVINVLSFVFCIEEILLNAFNKQVWCHSTAKFWK